MCRAISRKRSIPLSRVSTSHEKDLELLADWLGKATLHVVGLAWVLRRLNEVIDHFDLIALNAKSRIRDEGSCFRLRHGDHSIRQCESEAFDEQLI